MSDQPIRLKLINRVRSLISQDISYEDRSKYILFVSVADSLLYEEVIERGDNGARIRDQYMTEGLSWVHPFFYGHTVFWYAPTTKLCPVSDLSKEELIDLVGKQRELLKRAYENRQRL